jgi:hypothetical protein
MVKRKNCACRKKRVGRPRKVGRPSGKKRKQKGKGIASVAMKVGSKLIPLVKALAPAIAASLAGDFLTKKLQGKGLKLLGVR